MENMALNGSKVMVTGGAGFIGSHLVKKLKKIGSSVYVVDTAIDKQKQKYRCVDICDFENLSSFVKKAKIEYIFHLAAQPEVSVAYGDPRKTFETNIMGTINVLEVSKATKRLKGVIIASSDKAYGKMNKKKYLEIDRLQGDYPYEVSKSASDLVAQSYYKTYKLPVVITRFGNVYGEGDTHFSRLLPGIMRALVKMEPFNIRSDGTYIRDYIYVSDVVEGYILLAQNIKKVIGKAFNFGSDETKSVLEVIRTVENVLHKKLDFRILNTTKNEIPYQSLDWSKIRKYLGWEPRNNFKQTIPDIYDWYKNYFTNL